MSLAAVLAELRDTAIRLPLATVLGTALALRPRRRGTPPRQAAVVQTQIVLASVGAIVMLVVGSNLARAFGIVGVASLIRYRTKIDDPKDAVVMLSALAVGLAAGAGLYTISIFATVFLGERVGRWGWIGMAISLAGVGLIARAEAGEAPLGWGAGLVLIAAALQALYFVLMKPLIGRYGPLQATSYAVWAGAAVLLPWLPAGMAEARGSSSGALFAAVYLAAFPAAPGLRSPEGDAHGAAGRREQELPPIHFCAPPPSPRAGRPGLSASPPGCRGRSGRRPGGSTRGRPRPSPCRSPREFARRG